MNNRTKFHEVLAFDSIYQLLSVAERIYLHQCITGKDQQEASEKIMAIYDIIKQTHWKSPKMKYQEFLPDVLHFENDNELIPVADYPVLRPSITKLVNTLINK